MALEKLLLDSFLYSETFPWEILSGQEKVAWKNMKKTYKSIKMN